MYSSLTLMIIVILSVTVDTTYQKRLKSLYAHRTEFQLRDKHGCDALIESCGADGGCCDEHDACYKKYGCNSSSWSLVPIVPVCLFNKCCLCNMKVMACAVLSNPGVSSCCAEQNCGQKRQK